MDRLIKRNDRIADNLLLTDCSGAEYTGRLIPGDENFDFPEWSEDAKLNGVPVRVFYRTTPADEKLAEAIDWDAIDWGKRLTKIEDADSQIIWRV